MSSSPPTRRCCLKQKHRILGVGAVVQSTAFSSGPGSQSSGPSTNPSREAARRRGAKADRGGPRRAQSHTDGRRENNNNNNKKDPQSPATPMHQAPSEVAGPSLGGTFLLNGSCPPPSSLLPCRACQLRPGAWEASFAGYSRVAAAFPEASVCSLSYFIITSRRGYRSRGERGRERGRQRQRAGGRGKEAGGGKEKFRTQT